MKGIPSRPEIPHVTYVTRVDELEERLFEEAPRGALVLMLGAGNITDVAARLAKSLLTGEGTHVVGRGGA